MARFGENWPWNYSRFAGSAFRDIVIDKGAVTDFVLLDNSTSTRPLHVQSLALEDIVEVMLTEMLQGGHHSIAC